MSVKLLLKINEDKRDIIHHDVYVIIPSQFQIRFDIHCTSIPQPLIFLQTGAALVGHLITALRNQILTDDMFWSENLCD